MAKQDAKKARAKTPTALKRDLQNEKRRTANRNFKSTVRTAVRNFQEAVAKKDTAKSQEFLNVVYSLMDKGVKKGIFKLNKASRTKSRLTAKAAS